jgi:transmembrane sensor
MEEAALAWFARCQRGLSAEQEIEFQDWLTADARHAALFNELDGTWELLGRAGGAAPLAVAGNRRPSWRARLVRLGLPLAAAAALTLGYLAWWRPAHYAGETVTEVGAMRILRLPDGSLVTLNTDSAVAAAFTPAERRIRLERGEAHFAVAKNPDRPFIVEAGGVSVRAVGTAFNVRLEGRAVEVLVTEGKVRVDDTMSGQSLLAPPAGVSEGVLPALGHPVLTSGQKVVVALPAPVARIESPLGDITPTAVSAGEIQRKLSWQERRLDFELATLGEIAAEFNRYSRHQLVIGDPALAQRRFGGSFKPDDQAGFVRMLRENFGVTVDETETATVLRAGP